MDDTPTAAAARLLAGGDWKTLPEVAALLAPAVPADRALRAWDRLRAAGHKVGRLAPAARERIGRERVVQETLQHLAQRGRVEATGRGGGRLYRLRSDAVSAGQRPKPKREWVPLERATFDPRLQLRALPDGATFDEPTVVRYLEAKADGTEFPPLEAVEEPQGKKPPRIWVFAGFNRGEMYRRAGVNSVEMVLYPGTFADAEFYALSENSRHGLNRTPEDCRRAFDRLIDTPGLLQRVMAGVKDQGGIHRAFAAACGISHGAVAKYLADRGIQADRKTGKLVPVPKPEVAPEPPAPPARAADPDPDPDDGPIAATVPAPERTAAADGDPDLARSKDLVADLVSQFRAAGRKLNDLLRSRAGDKFRYAARAAGVPLDVKEIDRSPIGSKVPVVERVESWPAFAAIQAVINDVSNRLNAEG